MERGTIKSVVVDRGFGFISQPGLPDVFFHVKSLRGGLEFNEQLRERIVEFEIEDSPKGPRASVVQPIEGYA